MPYGVAKEHGGDSPANDARMEQCIKAVMAKGTPKLNAILICKSSLFGKK
jgi:hypothetical protein